MYYFLILIALIGLHVRRDIPLAELIGRYAQPPSRFVEVDGLQVHLRDEGEGPVVVLLHGAFASLHSWDGWVDELQDASRLIRFDLPGHGLTGPRPDGNYRVDAYVEFLDALMDSLEIGEFILAGGSFGGRIALEYALTHPEKLNGLILIDALGYLPSRTPFLFKLGRLPIAGELMTMLTPRYMVILVLREVYADPATATPEIVDRYHQLILRSGNRRAFWVTMGIPLSDLSDRIKEVKIPTLIMWGKEDTWIPLEHAYRFTRDLPQARLIIYPGVGHVPMEEVPRQSARDARQFITDLLGGFGRK